MAIVNEDVRIVKLLLDHGANVHERCLGSFFLPIDQKDKANIPMRKALERAKSREAQGQTVDIEEELDQMDLQSNHFSTLETNYDGLVRHAHFALCPEKATPTNKIPLQMNLSYAYWGEYPLSFATCLGLADCYKLLLAKGANPNRRDSNHNSTLHVAVIADRIVSDASLESWCQSASNLN